MSTTAIIIEHLIGGVLGATWIILLLLTVFGYHWVPIDQIKEFSVPIAFWSLAIVYPMGIFIDELADRLLHTRMQAVRDKRLQSEGLSPEDDTLTALNLLPRIDDEFVKSYFNYIRMRIRISRTATLNFPLIAATAVLFTVIHFWSSPSWWGIIITETILGIALTFFATWAWYRVSDTFAKQVARIYKGLNPIDKNS